MKNKKIILFLTLITCFVFIGYLHKNSYKSKSIESINMNTDSKKYVYPLGEIVGIKATTDGVLVLGHEEENVECIGGIKTGDNIIAINDIRIEKIEDVSEILDATITNNVKVTFERDGSIINESIVLKVDSDKKKLGLWVRDKISGIGTITFYDPQESSFKGIGHAITDFDTNELLKIKQGYIYGDFDLKNPMGVFKNNSNFGITGEFTSEKKKNSQLVEVGSKKDIKLGKACILLEDKNKNITSYDININNISDTNQSSRQISIEVADERLIDYTGGIIQGMSGAPIIQNNKLIGALTHVVKNNPKKGYGIFIDEMIELDSKN